MTICFLFGDIVTVKGVSDKKNTLVFIFCVVLCSTGNVDFWSLSVPFENNTQKAPDLMYTECSGRVVSRLSSFSSKCSLFT